MTTILHIPHSSTVIPDDLRGSFLLDDRELRLELLAMTDMHTNRLFCLRDAKKLIFPVSRLVCDPERFRNDGDESMSKIGMGAVYTSTHKLTRLRSTDCAEREAILKRFYDAHHRKFYELTKRALAENGHCLIVDCHSFPSKALPYEDETLDRPDICIGTDDFHTPKQLAEKLRESFETRGYRTEFNTPFAGSIVPIEFFGKDKRVASIMVEVNRILYMNESDGKRNESFEKTRCAISAAISEIERIKF